MVKIKRKEYRKFIRILIFFLERNIIFWLHTRKHWRLLFNSTNIRIIRKSWSNNSQIFIEPQTNDNGYYELMFFIDGEFQKVIVVILYMLINIINLYFKYLFLLSIEKATDKNCRGYSNLIGEWREEIHKI
jgi:hypothetical protein